MLIKIKKAQVSLEYAWLIGVIVAALLLMRVYLRRGFQGKYKASADQLGEQYDPSYTVGETETITTTTSTESTDSVGTTVVSTIMNQEMHKEEKVGKAKQE